MANRKTAKHKQRGASAKHDDVARARMLEYLADRGVDEEHADAAGFEPLDASAAHKLAGSAAAGRTAFRLPSRDLDGRPVAFERLRFTGEPSGWSTKTEKKLPKFWQQPNTPTRAYLPPASCVGRPWRVIAQDTSADLNLTEGEVKALSACLRGIPTIGITGVDNFHVGGDKDLLVPGLDAFEMKGRTVTITFDSDAAKNREVVRAENELCAALRRRGAFVHVVRLPPTPEGAKQGLDDFLLAAGPDAFRKLLANVERLPSGLDNGDDLFDQEFPPVAFAVFPYLPKGELVEIHGAHGQFKSTLMLYAALCVATGEQWCGGANIGKAGRAVFISLEDGSATLARRVRRWVKGGSKLDGPRQRDTRKLEQAIRRGFKFLGRVKASPLVLTEPDYGRRALARTAVVEWLAKTCAGFDLVVLETAARLNPCGEDNDTLAVLAGALEKVATRTGACVVLVRHVSKEAARTGQLDSYAGRGGGSLADAARCVLSVTRDGEETFDPVRIVHTKSTHTARGPDLAWRPELTDGEVYLKPMTPEERTNASAHRLREQIMAAGAAGITRRDLTRGATKKRCDAVDAGLARLVEAKAIVAWDDPKKPGRKAPTYFDAAFSPGATPEVGKVVPITEAKKNPK